MSKIIITILVTIAVMTLYTNRQKQIAVTSAYWSGYQVGTGGK